MEKRRGRALPAPCLADAIEVGTLSATAARHVGNEAWVGRTVRFSRHPYEPTCALHVFLEGERICTGITVGPDGIIPAASASPLN